MEVGLTCSSVGDVISIILLVKDIISALDDARGSAKAYRDLVHGMELLHQTLQGVDQALIGLPKDLAGYDSIVQAGEATVTQIQRCLEGFRRKVVKKYGASLSEGGSGNLIKDVLKKIQWTIEEKDVDKFRADVAGYTATLRMLLDVTAMRLAQYNHNAVTKHLQEVARSTTTAVSQHTRSVTRYLSLLGARILSKLDFVSRLGIDARESTSKILGMMFTMSGDLRAVVLRLDRGIDAGEHFVLEDATGRPFPIHLRTISSWEALDFILSDRFKGRKGERRIKRKLFSLHESASNMEIDRSARFEDAFVPYQKVDMSIVCKDSAPLRADSGGGLSSCPWCKTRSSGEVGARLQCSNCKRDFIRVLVEADEPMFPPSAPTPRRVLEVQFGKASFDAARKRARDEDSDEETCQECHQPKKAKKGTSDERKRKREPEEDESDEETVTGWAHVELQMKRMRLAETRPKPFQAVQAESFDAMAPKISSDGSAMLVTIRSAAPVYGDGAAFGDMEPDSRVTELSSSNKDEPDDVSMHSEEDDVKPTKRPRVPSLPSVVSDAMATMSEDTSMDPGSGSTDEPDEERQAPRGYYTPTPTGSPRRISNPYSSPSPSPSPTPSVEHVAKNNKAVSDISEDPREQSPQDAIAVYWLCCRCSVGNLENNPYMCGDCAHEKCSECGTPEAHYFRYLPVQKETQQHTVDARGRARRRSASSRASTDKPDAASALDWPEKQAQLVQARSATTQDAEKHRIPSGYILENWDPDEDPIVLLGSVFDAMSLGKWIYDWTVFRFGAGHPSLEPVAVDLWLHLFHLARKTKRAKKVVPHVRRAKNREALEDFIESGERLMDKLRELLRECETPILKAAQESPTLGNKAGIAFVETMFGLDGALVKTERWISSVKVWWSATNDEILRKPTANFVL